MRLIAYIRTSTEEQDTGATVQIKAIERYCEFNGDTLEDTLLDSDVSGGKPLEKRRAGRELIDALNAGLADGVIVHQLDRIFRNLGDGYAWLDQFDKQGWTLRTTEERVDTSTPDGWAAAIQKLFFADYERRKIAFRTKNAQMQMLAEGKVYSDPPYGTVAVGKYLYKEPREWAHRQYIYELYHQPGTDSYAKLRKHLFEMQLCSPKGKAKWSKSALRRLIISHHDFDHIPMLPTEHETVVSGEPLSDVLKEHLDKGEAE